MDYKRIIQVMANQPNVSISLIYDKYGSVLFGYILSIVKNESQAEEVLIKTLTQFIIKINDEPKKEKILTEAIRIANRTIMEITNIERKSLLKILEK